ncbi:MAG: SPFH domain-containing protein [Planctomycetota bacterium]|nr:SPFH domain-containing protein [Planctomycetota bacterium]
MSDNIPSARGGDGMKKLGVLAGGGMVSVLAIFIFVFAIVRVDVPADKVLIATKLSGDDLAEGEFIALEEGQKGVSLIPFNEGIHWINPYSYRTEIVDSTIIKPGELGVLVRLFGEDLPGSRLVATPKLGAEVGAEHVYKGVLEDPLGPGKYNINTRAYRVERYRALTIPPGYVGVSINIGDDLAPPGVAKNPYVNDSKGFKGISPEIRQPGTYYLNPYLEQLVLYEIRAQRFDFTKTNKKDNSIDFQSSDAFTLNLEGTIEWSILPEKAPELLCRLGELQEIVWSFDQSSSGARRRRPPAQPARGRRRPAPQKKVQGMRLAETDLNVLVDKILIPYTRSFIRVLGAQFRASEYISGEKRTAIQAKFKENLKAECAKFGIQIRNVSITRISPPGKLKEIRNDRSLQQEQRNRIKQNIEKLKSDATLMKKQESIRKSQLMVDASTTAEKRRIRARQDRNVGMKKAESELEVAKINKSKAEVEKERYVIDEKALIDQNFKKEAASITALALEVTANGGGSNYIRSIFVKKLGFGLQDIVTNDDSFFMKIFEDVLNFRSNGVKDLKEEERLREAARKMLEKNTADANKSNKKDSKKEGSK